MDKKRKNQTNLDDMTTSARARMVQDEDPLALSLSLSRSHPSSFLGMDLSLKLSETSTTSPSPTKPSSASTGLQLLVSAFQPLEEMPSQEPEQPPPLPLPYPNVILSLASGQDNRPTHPIANAIPHHPPCRNPVEFIRIPNAPAPFCVAVSPIPLSVSIQQQLQPKLSPSTEQSRRRSPPSPHPSPSLPMSLPPQRSTRQPRQTLAEGKDEYIDPPFPWFTNRRATVHPLHKLLEMGITMIPGPVQCRKCDFQAVMEYELQPKSKEVIDFILEKVHTMHNCALPEWMNPTFPPCPSCQTPNCMKPVIATKKRHINWLFMLLGQSIGTCTLDQLKYFCKHTKQHRTGSKNRLLFSTYIGICKQLKSDSNFADT